MKTYLGLNCDLESRHVRYGGHSYGGGKKTEETRRLLAVDAELTTGVQWGRTRKRYVSLYIDLTLTFPNHVYILYTIHVYISILVSLYLNSL